MQVHRLPSSLVIQAPAKLNLFFEVLGKRNDGYHEIETLVTPISLFDTLHFRVDPTGLLRLTCEQGNPARSGFQPNELPQGADNLVVRALELLRSRAGIRSGAAVHLVKRIPSAAGLGGGSSDAAAALMVANEGWDLGWPKQRLAELGAELGSDVPLFFARGPAVCRGRGEIVEPFAALGSLHFVVVRPPAGLSTAAVYRVCRPGAPPRRVEPLVDALRRGCVGKAGRLMFNRLQSAAETLSPWIERLGRALQDMDCLGHQMSGSGSCYFGVCRHAAHARRVAKRLEANGVGIAFAVQGSR